MTYALSNSAPFSASIHLNFFRLLFFHRLLQDFGSFNCFSYKFAAVRAHKFRPFSFLLHLSGEYLSSCLYFSTYTHALFRNSPTDAHNAQSLLSKHSLRWILFLCTDRSISPVDVDIRLILQTQALQLMLYRPNVAQNTRVWHNHQRDALPNKENWHNTITFVRRNVWNSGRTEETMTEVGLTCLLQLLSLQSNLSVMQTIREMIYHLGLPKNSQI